MECPEYKTCRREDSDGYGESEWTEALIDGQWVKHGLCVTTISVMYAGGESGETTIKSMYEKGVLVKESKETTLDRYSDPYSSDDSDF